MGKDSNEEKLSLTEIVRVREKLKVIKMDFARQYLNKNKCEWEVFFGDPQSDSLLENYETYFQWARKKHRNNITVSTLKTFRKNSWEYEHVDNISAWLGFGSRVLLDERISPLQAFAIYKGEVEESELFKALEPPNTEPAEEKNDTSPLSSNKAHISQSIYYFTISILLNVAIFYIWYVNQSISTSFLTIWTISFAVAIIFTSLMFLIKSRKFRTNKTKKAAYFVFSPYNYAFLAVAVVLFGLACSPYILSPPKITHASFSPNHITENSEQKISLTVKVHGYGTFSVNTLLNEIDGNTSIFKNLTKTSKDAWELSDIDVDKNIKSNNYVFADIIVSDFFGRKSTSQAFFIVTQSSIVKHATNTKESDRFSPEITYKTKAYFFGESMNEYRSYIQSSENKRFIVKVEIENTTNKFRRYADHWLYDTYLQIELPEHINIKTDKFIYFNKIVPPLYQAEENNTNVLYDMRRANNYGSIDVNRLVDTFDDAVNMPWFIILTNGKYISDRTGTHKVGVYARDLSVPLHLPTVQEFGGRLSITRHPFKSKQELFKKWGAGDCLIIDRDFNAKEDTGTISEGDIYASDCGTRWFQGSIVKKQDPNISAKLYSVENVMVFGDKGRNWFNVSISGAWGFPIDVVELSYNIFIPMEITNNIITSNAIRIVVHARNIKGIKLPPQVSTLYVE